MTVKNPSVRSNIINLMKKTVQSKNYLFEHEFSRVKNNEFCDEIILTRINNLIFDLKDSIAKLSEESPKNVVIVNNMVVAFNSTDKIYNHLLIYRGLEDASIFAVLDHYSKTFNLDLKNVSAELKNWLNENDIPNIMVRFHTSNKSWQLPYNEFLLKF